MSFHNKQKCVKTFSKLLLFAMVLLFVAVMSGCADDDAEVLVPDSGAAEDISEQTESQADQYIYGIPIDDDAAVITESVADVYESPDVKAARITQVLYNQPVSVVSSDGGWSRVKTVNGITGWIKSKHISNDVSSISGRVYTYRIIVTSKEKTVYSGPSGGITRVNAHMGTEFYAFNNIDDAYEVFLPGNITGWLQGSGIIRIPVNDAIPVTNADDFAATALKFKGIGFMLKGMSSMGIDSSGLVYICARINGVNLPVTLEGQAASGVEISPESSQAGDLVFLSGTGDSDTGNITCVGICTGGGSYIYAGRKTGYVAVGDIFRENPDGIVVAARRIFN